MNGMTSKGMEIKELGLYYVVIDTPITCFYPMSFLYVIDKMKPKLTIGVLVIAIN